MPRRAGPQQETRRERSCQDVGGSLGVVRFSADPSLLGRLAPQEEKKRNAVEALRHHNLPRLSNIKISFCLACAVVIPI